MLARAKTKQRSRTTFDRAMISFGCCCVPRGFFRSRVFASTYFGEIAQFSSWCDHTIINSELIIFRSLTVLLVSEMFAVSISRSQVLHPGSQTRKPIHGHNCVVRPSRVESVPLASATAATDAVTTASVLIPPTTPAPAAAAAATPPAQTRWLYLSRSSSRVALLSRRPPAPPAGGSGGGPGNASPPATLAASSLSSSSSCFTFSGVGESQARHLGPRAGGHHYGAGEISARCSTA